MPAKSAHRSYFASQYFKPHSLKKIHSTSFPTPKELGEKSRRRIKPGNRARTLFANETEEGANGLCNVVPGRVKVEWMGGMFILWILESLFLSPSSAPVHIVIEQRQVTFSVERIASS